MRPDDATSDVVSHALCQTLPQAVASLVSQRATLLGTLDKVGSSEALLRHAVSHCKGGVPEGHGPNSLESVYASL